MRYFQVYNPKHYFFFKKKLLEFEEKPIKSASIAQVHVGVLRENNKKVAVKVQHKWLKEQSNGDISLVAWRRNEGKYPNGIRFCE